jgi:hypothetical protein
VGAVPGVPGAGPTAADVPSAAWSCPTTGMRSRIGSALTAADAHSHEQPAITTRKAGKGAPGMTASAVDRITPRGSCGRRSRDANHAMPRAGCASGGRPHGPGERTASRLGGMLREQARGNELTPTDPGEVIASRQRTPTTDIPHNGRDGCQSVSLAQTPERREHKIAWKCYHLRRKVCFQRSCATRAALHAPTSRV